MGAVSKARATKVGLGSSDFLAEVDGRSLIARRYNEISSALIRDLGGDAVVSEAQRQLVRRATTIAVQAELMEAGLANGERFDLDAYAKGANTLNRILTTLGLRRHARDITPGRAVDAHAAALMDAPE